MRFTPNRLLVAPSGGEDSIDFAALLGAVADGRPLYAAANPQNANGLITQGSTNGTVAGLDLVVDPNYTGTIQMRSMAWFIHHKLCDSMSQEQLSFVQTLLLTDALKSVYTDMFA
jgi:hypothetical protein